MRSIRILPVLALIASVGLVGCDRSVSLTVENRTDSAFVAYMSPPHESRAVGPRASGTLTVKLWRLYGTVTVYSEDCVPVFEATYPENGGQIVIHPEQRFEVVPGDRDLPMLPDADPCGLEP